MSLRLRLAGTFAFVALLTGLAVALAAPTIVGRGFASLEADAGIGPGNGRGPGPMAGVQAQQIQEETTQRIALVALVAATGATLLGVVIAGRIAAPLRRLEEAAAAVAGGNLGRRSGLAGRQDEIGSLGRSFDAMAEDLAAAEASRRRFFQDAAHELKTPLAVIEATTTAVLDGVYEHDDVHLQTIREQSRVLARIVDDLRTISLAEAGDLPLDSTTVDLAEVAASARQAFAARAELAGVLLASLVAPGSLVVADGDRLGQVLAACLDNALRHTPAGGSVTIASEGRPPRVRLSVSDTGPGIPPEAIAHVFDRFYRADTARDRSSGTSGLGLSIVRALVVAQGGAVGAEDVPGGGARVWIELPAAPPGGSATTTPRVGTSGAPS
jgi:two-component system sensor histidine kinase BaeS